MSVQQKRRPVPVEKMPMRLIVFSAAGTLLMIVLFLLSAFFILQKELSSGTLSVFAFACVALSSLPAGFLCAKGAPRHKAVFGILSVLPQLLCLVILSMVYFGKVGGGFAAVCALAIVSAAVGAILAVRRRKTKTRRYKQ